MSTSKTQSFLNSFLFSVVIIYQNWTLESSKSVNENTLIRDNRETSSLKEYNINRVSVFCNYPLQSFKTKIKVMRYNDSFKAPPSRHYSGPLNPYDERFDSVVTRFLSVS